VCRKYEQRLSSAKESQEKGKVELDEEGLWMKRTKDDFELEKTLRNATGLSRL
jgi:hypothetical protein